jgi:CheY-like chemotaxis protein
MISDPHPTVSRMLVRMVAGLGYEAVAVSEPPTPAQLRAVDVLLLEPASPTAAALARTALAANPSLAILGEGATPSPQDSDWSDASLVGQLAKPFTSEQLDAALQQALAHRDQLAGLVAGRSN